MKAPYDEQAFGEPGNITVDAGTTVHGNFCAIQFIEESTFTALVDAAEKTALHAGAVAASTKTYPAMYVIYGHFTTVNLATGSARLTYAAKKQ